MADASFKQTGLISANLSSTLLSSFDMYLSSFQHLPLIENFHGKNLVRVLHLHNCYLEYTNKKNNFLVINYLNIMQRIFLKLNRIVCVCLLFIERFWCRYNSCLIAVTSEHKCLKLHNGLVQVSRYIMPQKQKRMKDYS